MNKYLFIDAIGCLDLKLIEEHFLMREKIKTNKMIKKKYNAFKKALVASCLVLFFFSAFLIFNQYVNSREVVSAATTCYLLISLIACLACTVMIGIVAWTIGKKIIANRNGKAPKKFW